MANNCCLLRYVEISQPWCVPRRQTRRRNVRKPFWMDVQLDFLTITLDKAHRVPQRAFTRDRTCQRLHKENGAEVSRSKRFEQEI